MAGGCVEGVRRRSAERGRESRSRWRTGISRESGRGARRRIRRLARARRARLGGASAETGIRRGARREGFARAPSRRRPGRCALRGRAGSATIANSGLTSAMRSASRFSSRPKRSARRACAVGRAGTRHSARRSPGSISAETRTGNVRPPSRDSTSSPSSVPSSGSLRSPRRSHDRSGKEASRRPREP